MQTFKKQWQESKGLSDQRIIGYDHFIKQTGPQSL